MNSKPTDSATAPRMGVAVACCVFGVLAFLSGVVLVGGLFGVVGVILGIIHLARRQSSNGLAWLGVGLSLAGIAISVTTIVVVYNSVAQFWQDFTRGVHRDQGDYANWAGVVAPDMTVTSIDGQTIRLSDLKGKRVVIDFWATWCGPCLMEIPHFIKLRETVSADELVIVGISSEDVKTLKNFVKTSKINYPIVSATDLPAPFDSIEAIPTTFFIDRNGVIQDVVVGYHELNDLKRLATGEDYSANPKVKPVSGNPRG